MPEDPAPDHSAPRLRRVLSRLRQELGAVAALAIAAGGVLAFGELADEVVEGEHQDLDQALLLMLRRADDPASPIGPGWLVQAVTDISALGGYAVLSLLVFGTSLYLLLLGRRAAAGFTVGAVVSGVAISLLLKSGFSRARPDVVEHLTHTMTASFPSGHAMLSAVVYLTLGSLLVRIHPRRSVQALLMGYAVGITVLVGISRVYLGVHWPSDVLGGWIIGAAWAALCWLVAWRLERGWPVGGAHRKPPA